MKNRFTDSVKVIEVLDSLGYLCGVVRRSKIGKICSYYARRVESPVEVFFDSEQSARRFLLSDT